MYVYIKMQISEGFMNKDKRKIIAYIGGGSINFGWNFLAELANEEIYAQVNLYDLDKQLSLANEVIGNKFLDNPNAKSDIIYLATDTPEEALKNADIVVMSINVGSIEELVSELTLPEAYGIYQSTAENAGPSSIIKSLKTLPVYIKYAELIKKLCPNAWVINLTNPMSTTMLIMKEIFPEIKIFGSSNENFQTNELIAGMVMKEYGIIGVKPRDIKYNILGICGFSWYNDIRFKGEDIMPIFRKYATKYCESGYELHTGEYRTNPLMSANKIKFDLFLRYGIIPATSDRIIADFCPNWYLKSPSVISDWKFSQTSVNHVKKLRLERISKVKALMNGSDSLPVGGYTSDVVLQIKALLGNGNLITNICSKNVGQVANLPENAIVMSNGLISKNSVKAVTSGRLPDDVFSLAIRHVYNQRTVLKSVTEKDLDIAFNAFLNEPLMSADLDSATELYKEMLFDVHKHLEYYC